MARMNFREALSGHEIKNLRILYGLSQQRFGERLGITHAHVSKIESGKETPSTMLIKLINYEFPEKTVKREQTLSISEMSSFIDGSLKVLQVYFHERIGVPEDFLFKSMCMFSAIVDFFEVAQHDFTETNECLTVFHGVIDEITMVLQRKYTNPVSEFNNQALVVQANSAKLELQGLFETTIEKIDSLLIS